MVLSGPVQSLFDSAAPRFKITPFRARWRYTIRHLTSALWALPRIPTPDFHLVRQNDAADSISTTDSCRWVTFVQSKFSSPSLAIPCTWHRRPQLRQWQYPNLKPQTRIVMMVHLSATYIWKGRSLVKIKGRDSRSRFLHGAVRHLDILTSSSALNISHPARTSLNSSPKTAYPTPSVQHPHTHHHNENHRRFLHPFHPHPPAPRPLSPPVDGRPTRSQTISKAPAAAALSLSRSSRSAQLGTAGVSTYLTRRISARLPRRGLAAAFPRGSSPPRLAS